MSLLLSKTKWLWFLLALYSGPAWSPVACVSVKIPPKTLSNVETQAKFFQDFFSVQLSPYKIEFGHVCEDPNTWEQRYEKKDYKNHRDMGKVRWGDKKGGYGEHYWDLNHAGHAGNHGDDDYNGHNNHDDGSYHSDDHDVPSTNSYDSPSDHSYTSDDYDPEKSSYEENGRAKRAHSRHKHEKRHKVHQDEEETRPKNRKYKEQPQEQIPHKVENYYDESEEDDEIPKKPKRTQHKHKVEEEDEEAPEPKDAKKQVVLVVKEKEEEPASYVPPKQIDYTKYVPYDSGAGVRQHYQPEPTAAASVPRLFLEPTTGHVVDRATGQAYVLQPVTTYKHN